MKSWRFVSFALAVPFLFFLNSCETGSGVATFQPMSTWWDIALMSDFQAAAAVYDDMDIICHSAGSAEEQASQIKKAVRHGADAIVVNAIDSEHVLPVVENAYDSGVYVILLGNMIPTKKFHVFAGTNNMELGTMAGHLVENALPDGGNVVELTVDSDQPFFHERKDGFHDVIDANDKVNIIASVVGDWSQEKAHAAIDSLKMSLGDTPVDLIYSYGDDMLLGALKSGMYPNAKFVGTDGIPGESLQHIASGDISFSILTQTGAHDAISAAYNLINGFSCDRFVFCRPVLVDSTNVFAVSSSISDTHFLAKKSMDLRSSLHKAKARLSRYIDILYLALFLLTLGCLNHVLNISSRRRREKMAFAPDSLAGRFVSYVENHLSETNLLPELIALALETTPQKLNRTIRFRTGESICEFIQSIRLKKADELLKTSALTIYQICSMTGFASPADFPSRYYKKYGTLPTAKLQ